MRREIALLLMITLIAAGCASPRLAHRSQLLRLDGFQPGDAVVIDSVDGSAVPFTRDTTLGLVLAGGQEIKNRYVRIDVIEGVFYGQVRETEAQVAVALESVDHVRLWPEGETDTGMFAIQVFTMWVVFGILGALGYLLIKEVDWDDVDVHVVIHN